MRASIVAGYRSPGASITLWICKVSPLQIHYMYLLSICHKKRPSTPFSSLVNAFIRSSLIFRSRTDIFTNIRALIKRSNYRYLHIYGSQTGAVIFASVYPVSSGMTRTEHRILFLSTVTMSLCVPTSVGYNMDICTYISTSWSFFPPSLRSNRTQLREAACVGAPAS